MHFLERLCFATLLVSEIDVISHLRGEANERCPGLLDVILSLSATSDICCSFYMRKERLLRCIQYVRTCMHAPRQQAKAKSGVCLTCDLSNKLIGGLSRDTKNSIHHGEHRVTIKFNCFDVVTNFYFGKLLSYVRIGINQHNFCF